MKRLPLDEPPQYWVRELHRQPGGTFAIDRCRLHAPQYDQAEENLRRAKLLAQSISKAKGRTMAVFGEKGIETVYEHGEEREP